MDEFCGVSFNFKILMILDLVVGVGIDAIMVGIIDVLVLILCLASLVLCCRALLKALVLQSASHICLFI
jgi:hypothetical protein